MGPKARRTLSYESQIMENVIQYYLHVYDSALRIYSQKKSEYRTANYLYGALPVHMQGRF